MEDFVWYHCENCEEEYELPEGYDAECPVCGKYELEPV